MPIRFMEVFKWRFFFFHGFCNSESGDKRETHSSKLYKSFDKLYNFDITCRQFVGKSSVEEVDNPGFELDAVHTPAGITFTFVYILTKFNEKKVTKLQKCCLHESQV